MSGLAMVERVPVQLYLPAALVEEIDRRAADETISRAAWIRRLLIGATRRADNSMNSGSGKPYGRQTSQQPDAARYDHP